MKTLDISDTTGQLQELVSEIELTGKQVHFLRNGAPVVVLITRDEHVALTETVALAAEPALQAAIRAADAEASAGDLYLLEELSGE